MIAYAERIGTFRTPKGAAVQFVYREETNDWNTLHASLDTDEYRLADLRLTGWAVDVGGYLGSVAIGLAVDNPELRVLVVEPVPDNGHLIARNAEMNGVTDRIAIVGGAVGHRGLTTSEIRYGYRGDPNLEHHAFVGNTSVSYDSGGDVPHETRQVVTYGLAALLDAHDIDEPSLLKIDCEGAEWAFFDTSGRDLRRLPLIVGEVHPVRGHVARDIVPILGLTHDVTLYGSDPGPAEFRAVRKA